MKCKRVSPERAFFSILLFSSSMDVTMGLHERLCGDENACGASPAVCMWETLFYSLNDVHTDKHHDTSSQCYLNELSAPDCLRRPSELQRIQTGKGPWINHHLYWPIQTQEKIKCIRKFIQYAHYCQGNPWQFILDVVSSSFTDVTIGIRHCVDVFVACSRLSPSEGTIEKAGKRQNNARFSPAFSIVTTNEWMNEWMNE